MLLQLIQRYQYFSTTSVYIACMALSSGRGAGEAAIKLAPVSAAGSVLSTDRPPAPVGSLIVSASSVSAAGLVAGLPILLFVVGVVS